MKRLTIDYDGAHEWLSAELKKSKVVHVKKTPVFVKTFLAVDDIRYAQLLIHDRRPEVRQAIASRVHQEEYKQFIPRLLHDKSPLVRAELARQASYGTYPTLILDTLRNDKDALVRLAVAKHGREQDLDLFVTDKDPAIRAIVALGRKDEHLDVLVNDPEPQVRVNVAKIGRDKDLDILVEDDDDEVRAVVASHLRPQDIATLHFDSSWLVQQVFAENLDAVEDYRRIWFMTSDIPAIRRTAMRHANKSELSHLVDDPVQDISIYATEKYLELQDKDDE